jgi:hypothetical protein
VRFVDVSVDGDGDEASGTAWSASPQHVLAVTELRFAPPRSRS